MVRIENLTEYLTELLGLSFVPVSAPEQTRNKLPLFLKAGFDYYLANIEGQSMVFALNKGIEKRNPLALKKHKEEIQRVFGVPVIFVFEQLDAYERKRLVINKIAFAQPAKQIYMPGYVWHFNERQSTGTTAYENSCLSMPAQLALLYHLQVASMQGFQFQEIGHKIKYSAMTVTRIAQELKQHSVIEIEGSKTKRAWFKKEGKQLWEHIKHSLRSPVIQEFYSDDQVDSEHIRKSGDNALASYSLLAERDQISFAIGKEEFRALKKLSKIQRVDSTYGKYRLEIWGYNPVLLAQHDKKVDKLSLYLSMINIPDERVKFALEEMINEMSW